MKEDAVVASDRIPKAFVVTLLVALSLSFLALISNGPIVVLFGMLAFLASVIAWVLSIARLPKGPDGSRALHIAPLVLAPILLIAPAGQLSSATVDALVAERRAEIMRAGEAHERHLHEASEANAAVKHWIPISVLLGLLAAVLEVLGIRLRTGEFPGGKLVVSLFVLFASFGPLVHLYIRAHPTGLTS